MRRCLLLALALALAFASQGLASDAGSLEVRFFDVGQGDAALILSPTGKSVLVDGGPQETGAALAERVKALLGRPLDLTVLTHRHLDHVGGLERILREVGTRRFLEPDFPHSSPPYFALRAWLDGRDDIDKLRGEAGRSIDLGGGATMKLLWPQTSKIVGSRSDVNANSVVLRLSFGGAAFLFAGDLEPDAETALARGDLPVDARVLKVPHHGSRLSSTSVFLARVKPEIAVISCGAHNDYGHPAPATLRRLVEAGARIYRTDRDGEVLVRTDGKDIEVTSHAAPAALRQPAVSRAADAGEGSSAAPAAAAFVGSSRSELFHRGTCARGPSRMSPARLVRWNTREEATAAGRRPAACCMP